MRVGVVGDIRNAHNVYYFNKSCRFRSYNTVFSKKARKGFLNFGVHDLTVLQPIPVVTIRVIAMFTCI